MQSVLEQVTQAAAARAHVLISGEAGAGREWVAREIHRRSVRDAASFIRVACVGPPAEQLELNLFGYPTDGDSTPLMERRALERIARGGRLYEALGGTMFFEHLPEMPSRLQAKLARLFRDREAVGVQDKAVIGFDVRAIAAVDDSYHQALQEGRVREDLHRVISVLRIEIPPLRKRREDIPALTGFFLAGLCRQARVPIKSISEPAQQLLVALPWYGNARELKILLEALVMRVAGDVIRLEDVLACVQLDGRARPSNMGTTLREARTRFEREYITAVLEQHHGRVPQAARTLGIQRTNLYRKLRRLKLSPKRRNGG